MKKIYIILLVLTTLSANAQENKSAFKAGEWLKFRLHYGIFNASYATLQVKNDKINNIPVYHVAGEGSTVGLARIFFKVDDVYESYFDKENGRPYKFIRKVSEGGYTIDLDIDFDYQKKKAILNDNKKGKKIEFTIQDNIQDLISAFYYLRNNYKAEELVKGEFIELDLLYDDDGIFKFKLKYLGTEVLKTKFGKVECHKFRPYVESGRVFKAQESLSLWVSNDDNKIPIRIKADLAVGSIKADLDGYAGLKHQFKIIMD
ncbi:DUF3108 domain-containing protein [Cellulophaga sp. F20128]|uniref:DUF3108 domain-containing protein n=1 Tax=Cellulophaga sp. F20128 TaxID=2926413 RepID=UPI001FF51F98|nr:DUF3108 domain-containing protein [Cellulophaga sp. F20128]MCK0157430.1 DUF3108 domain-containing protein [Cellulophaga sp. F20128]